jgi:hypothetical protein
MLVLFIKRAKRALLIVRFLCVVLINVLINLLINPLIN